MNKLQTAKCRRVIRSVCLLFSACQKAYVTKKDMGWHNDILCENSIILFGSTAKVEGSQNLHFQSCGMSHLDIFGVIR